METQNNNSNKDKNATCDNAVLSFRLFKFRFWIKRSKFMTEPVNIGEIFDYQDQVLNNITMQFTGLYDKNGKEIYEGDFIENKDKIIYKIIFKEGTFDTTYNDMHFIDLKHFYTENIEVVGNVFENPELL